VLERHEPDPGKQLLLAAVLEGVPLHGRELVERWRATAATYPDELVRAVVGAHVQIDHFWRFEMFRERANPLLAARATVEIHERLLHVLLGINRRWYSGFKLLDAVAERLTIAPADFMDRLRSSYDPRRSEALLGPLVEETYDLVEQHVPGIDVARLRAIFRYRRPLWDSAPDD